ncbi:regulatory protein ral2 [Coprinopsis sp. MPI-PUGE-AT-0042]|nr:regulatory protein ral2 [Coprinopsis sp. MPI-PUGE-AT-0042]
MLHSIYDLTTYCRRTAGDVPAKLVGASTTIVGSKMYLFGGRLVTERRMVADLYVFDIETFVWEKVQYAPTDNVPQPRYFHSADSWNNHLVIFGGMSNKNDPTNPEELGVLNDVRLFDLKTYRWLPEASHAATPEGLIPKARYAHLSAVTADRLFIIGGQDVFNAWLDDVCVYDFVAQVWANRRDYPRHCGTYRSVAVAGTHVVRNPEEELQASYASSTLGPPGARFRSEKDDSNHITPALTHLPYSATPTEDHPSDIFLYSNYNFTDVKRELEVFSPLPDVDFTIQDRSSAMLGSTFPPGLRFPTGAILGQYLIIAGTYLAHSFQSYSIWVLDMVAMTWSRIDAGKALESGSWFRSCLYTEANNWEHVAIIDLEAFGIYSPPALKLDIRMQELGLAALEEKVLTDFEIVCEDGRKIPCSRKLLDDRWPWFKETRLAMLKSSMKTLSNLPHSAMDVPLPEVPGSMSFEQPRLDPRLTPRQFFLSEPYPVALALVQYLYSLALITPLQHAPVVLNQLLIMSMTYKLPHLHDLVKHAMHRSLSNSTSVGVYEVATLCSSRSLQIRALKTVMSYTQKRPTRARGSDRESSSRSRDDHGRTNQSSYLQSDSQQLASYPTRPRGTSDARWHTNGMMQSNSTNGYSSSEFSR